MIDVKLRVIFSLFIFVIVLLIPFSFIIKISSELAKPHVNLILSIVLCSSLIIVSLISAFWLLYERYCDQVYYDIVESETN